MFLLPFHHRRRRADLILTAEIRRAGGNRFNNTEALMSYPFRNDVSQKRRVIRCSAGSKGRPRRPCQIENIKGRLNRQIRRGRRPAAFRRERRILTARHTVNAVIEYDQREINIAACRVDKMVAADGGAIAVAARHENGKLGARHFKTGSDGKRPAMQRICRVEIDVTRRPAGTADPGNEGHLILRERKPLDRFAHSRCDNAVAAAGTPKMGKPPGAEIFLDQRFFHDCPTLSHIFFMTASISSGVADSLSYLA